MRRKKAPDRFASVRAKLVNLAQESLHMGAVEQVEALAAVAIFY